MFLLALDAAAVEAMSRFGLSRSPLGWGGGCLLPGAACLALMWHMGVSCFQAAGRGGGAGPGGPGPRVYFSLGPTPQRWA